MFRYQRTGKCRAPLTCYSLLRRCHRTKTSAATVNSPKFERDAAPHQGLVPRPDSARPRAVTSRPSVRGRDRSDPQNGQQKRALIPPWSPSPLPSTSAPVAAPVAPIKRQLTIDDFFHPKQSVSAPSDASKSSDDTLPSEFTSPPLLPELHKSLMETLGPFAHPTPIQSLSLKWVLREPPPSEQPNWRQFFLASETGSGKSIAYLLPLLQSIKQAELAELAERGERHSQSSSKRLYNPRGLILAPTHELTRQLSGFAKSLLHELKLRVMCASQANMKSTKKMHATSRKMVAMFDDGEGPGEFQVSKVGGHGVDLLVGTPMKLLEMVRGRGWDKRRDEENQEEEEEEDDEASVDEETDKRKPRRGRDFAAGFGRTKTVELGLQNIEWVVVDEADVLLDPDFQATTRLLLSDISAARDHPIPPTPAPELEGSSQRSHPLPAAPTSYPFNLILTSATIPNSLNRYLQNHHPSLIRLSSPDLHHLPKTLEIEHVPWSGGNKFADIHRRIRQIWAEDAASAPDRSGTLSKVLIFCNKSTKVIELSEYLEQQGAKCVPMTSASEHRNMGSNRHLAGFVKKPSIVETVSKKKALKSLRRGIEVEAEAASPLVMVTTSLLSRGLDFSPEVKHVFIVDEPRNMVDFLHRAGRSGRAGHKGKVVVFGKLSGRGSERGREIKRRVVGLKARRKVDPNPKPAVEFQAKHKLGLKASSPRKTKV